MRASRGAALDYLAQRFGGLLREEQSTASVGVAAAVIAQGDSERVSLTVANLSVNDVYLTCDRLTASTRGIRISPGGTWSVNVEEDSLLPTLEWSAIASAAASACYVLSVKRDTLTPAG
jgi:hypothetical protein